MRVKFEHWRLDKDEQNIIWLTIDRAHQSLNYLNTEVFFELEAILDLLEIEKNAKGMILRSGKESDFILGMDLNYAQQFHKQKESASLIYDLTLRVQKILDRLERLPFPTVALIKGLSIGGGFEIPLAMTYRVADSETAIVGLPETKIGINPNWGGIYRLPKLIGGVKALDLILSGRLINAKQALKYGCIDACVPEDKLEKTAINFILKKPKPKHPTFLENLTNRSLIRPIIANFILKKLKAKANPNHYPAPYAALNFWKNHGCKNNGKLREMSAQTASELFYTPTCKNLLRIFFLQQNLKHLGKKAETDIQHIHVVGAGIMGGDIAAWAALQGYSVSLQDREMKYIEPALQRAEKLFNKKIHDVKKREKILAKLQPDVTGEQIKNSDLIIEAIFEDKSAKRKIYSEIEPRMKAGAILASNTSCIPLEELAEGLTDKSRFIGLHFFNPVAMLPLVEVVSSEFSSEYALNQGMSFVQKIKKLPLPTKSDLGFFVNRVLMAYNEEALILYFEENVPGAYIDKQLVDFGMPMGPIELIDVVGIDISVSVAKKFIEAGVLKRQLPEKLLNLLAAGHLGKKTGQGIYTWKGNKASKPKYPSNYSKEDLQERIILRLLNECVACLRKKIVSSEDRVDAGTIFATGFAPFRGGPLNYAHDYGIAAIVAKLEDFSKKYGERFLPDEGWKQLG